LSRFLNHISGPLAEADSILDAGETVRRHAKPITRRWPKATPTRLEGVNDLLQAARGHRSAATFACIIYLIVGLLGDLFGLTHST